MVTAAMVAALLLCVSQRAGAAGNIGFTIGSGGQRSDGFSVGLDRTWSVGPAKGFVVGFGSVMHFGGDKTVGRTYSLYPVGTLTEITEWGTGYGLHAIAGAAINPALAVHALVGLSARDGDWYAVYPSGPRLMRSEWKTLTYYGGRVLVLKHFSAGWDTMRGVSAGAWLSF